MISTRFDPLSIDEVGTPGSINLTEGTSGNSSIENSFTPNFAQTANPNSQVQVNLTSQTSGDNSTNDYTGNQFFGCCGGQNFGCHSRGGCSRGRGGGGRGHFFDVLCQICYKIRHGASFCYHRLDENYVPTLPLPPSIIQWTSSALPSQQIQYAQLVQYAYFQPPPYVIQAPKQPTNSLQIFLTSSAATPSQSWYPDSGASHHVTNMSQNIQQVAPFEEPIQIIIGNGQGLNINSSGLSTFSSPINPQFSLVLSNLLFVPTITKNLIRVSQFCKDNNVYFEFHSYVCLFKS